MGYLICDKCGGYYELQPGEKPEDFSNECECGGKLFLPIVACQAIALATADLPMGKILQPAVISVPGGENIFLINASAIMDPRTKAGVRCTQRVWRRSGGLQSWGER